MFYFFKYILTLNILFIFLAFYLCILLFLNRWAYQALLKNTYFTLSCSYIFPLLAFIPQNRFFMHHVNTGFSVIQENTSYSTIPLICLAVFYLYFSIRHLNEYRVLLKIKNDSYKIKKYKNISLLSSENIGAPFSFYLFRRAYVLLPEYLFSKPDYLKHSLAHEFQHHRQNDTKWMPVLAVTKLFCFWNPFFYLFERKLSQLQEYACDEALIGRQCFSSSIYSRCLLWVAKQSLSFSSSPKASLGLVIGNEKNLLRRRIEEMFTEKKTWKILHL